MEHQSKALTPRSIINILGKLSYSEGAGAWSILRLKKEIIKEFPQLKEKRSKFSYKMKYFRNFYDLENAIKQMKKDKSSVLPLLVWFYKDG